MQQQFLKAVQLKHLALIKSLVESRNLDVNYVYPELDNRTALHVAAFDGSVDIVRLLVEQGHADVNIQSSLGEAPIHEAGNMDHIEVVRYLADNGSMYTEDVEDMLSSEPRKTS